MSTPQISVLMPAYNAALYLAEAIESILNQTFGDFELIILDDGSTDGSEAVVKGFTDSRIIYHKNEKNLGLANNLNVGLRMARGKYIARMDGDDISLPDRFQTQIDFLESHPDIDLCSCGLQMFGKEDTIWIREADPEAVKITMMFYSPVLHATSVWRRESFEKHNLYYDQDAFPAEDYDLWSRAVFYCKLVNIPQVLYRYRIHGIQVTKQDKRSEERTRHIRINYIKNALPMLREASCVSFVDKFISSSNQNLDFGVLKSLYKNILKANKEIVFFQQNLLQQKLTKYYQSLLVNEFKKSSSFKIKLFFFLKLKLKFKIKLLIKKK